MRTCYKKYYFILKDQVPLNKFYAEWWHVYRKLKITPRILFNQRLHVAVKSEFLKSAVFRTANVAFSPYLRYALYMKHIQFIMYWDNLIKSKANNKGHWFYSGVIWSDIDGDLKVTYEESGLVRSRSDKAEKRDKLWKNENGYKWTIFQPAWSAFFQIRFITQNYNLIKFISRLLCGVINAF